MRPALLGLLIGAAGCAARPAPYRFAGPVVGAVSLDAVAEHGIERRRPGALDDGLRPATRPAGPAAIARAVPAAPTRIEVPRDAAAHAGAGGVRADDLHASAALPEPHREARARDGEAAVELPPPGGADVAALRALVGRRDGRADVAFALAAAAALRGPPPAALPWEPGGPALVAHAEARGARAAPGTRAVRPGDLLVFDRARGGAAASLVAVVLSADGRGVIEMLYVARGVVRRGFVDPSRPRVARDDAGRVVNTYVRHAGDAPPRGTRYLAGELLAHVIAWDAL